MQYTDFQNMPASEKITLAVMEASKRLMGWSLHSGSVYKLTGFTHAVIASLEDSGTAYTEVISLGTMGAGTFYLDRENQTLYVQTTGSDNPNGRFLVVTVKLYFANTPIVLPHDLATSFEVYWEPLIQSTSEFGVEIDTISQASEAIEGSGSLSLINDLDFWPKNFDKLTFENQACLIYSYHRDMAPSDAKPIFDGRVEKKSYGDKIIRFQLKDQFAELRSPVQIANVSELGERTGSDIANAKQRMILGRVFGHVPVNIDQELDGYPLTGTVSISFASSTLNGSGTQFLKQLSPDDRLILGGTEYTVATVPSNTQATLTETFTGSLGLSGATAYLLAELPKRFMNRRWKVAGHAIREPVTYTQGGGNVTQFLVDDSSEFYPDDFIYVGELGSGELVKVASVSGRLIKLQTSLASALPIGTKIRRPGIQNVRINDTFLVYYQDYTFDAATATLTLRDTAEANSAPIRQLTTTLAFTSGSRTVSGSGLKNSIKPGYMVGIVGNANFFEVLSVDSETQLTLRTAATFTATATGRYKALIYDHGEDTLSCDVLGRTLDGTSDGALLKTSPQLVKALLTDAGLASRIDNDSFTEADGIAYQEIGMVIPATFSDQTTPSYRDLINKLNKSVFGSLVQTDSFKFAYEVLQPTKPVGAVKFNEADILSFGLQATAENAVKTVTVEYQAKEYDYLTGQGSKSTKSTTSDVATHILRTTREKRFESFLVNEQDADILARRWSMLLENTTGRLTFNTKLQGASLEVGQIVEVRHRKFFERFGGSGKRKLLLVESVKKSGSGVSVEAVDLSNTFNRIAALNDFTSDYSTASEDEKLYGGFLTDDFGLINNDPESFGTNLIW